MSTKLCQVLAIEKGVKSRVNGAITKLYHAAQKPVLFSGLTKSYEPLDEDGLCYPPESQKVQVRAGDILKTTKVVIKELFDVTAQKDFANCHAKADVKVCGKVLLEQAPVTYLLFLEKQLTDLKTLVAKLPILDASEDWHWDAAAGLFKSTAVKSTRTQKVQKPIVLYQATENHPAQTQLISEDVVVGHWTTTKHSAAMPIDDRVELLERIEKVLKAVKFAREEANASAANEVDTSGVLNFIFG